MINIARKYKYHVTCSLFRLLDLSATSSHTYIFYIEIKLINKFWDGVNGHINYCFVFFGTIGIEEAL